MSSKIANRWAFRTALLSLLCCGPLAVDSLAQQTQPTRQSFATQPITQPNNPRTAQPAQTNPQQQFSGGGQVGAQSNNPGLRPSVPANGNQAGQNYSASGSNAQGPGQLVGQPSNAQQVRNPQTGAPQLANTMQPNSQPVAVPPGGQPVQIVPLNQAVQNGMANVVQQPFPPLSSQEQDYVDRVLDLWEKRTTAITTFECKFRRFAYNPAVHQTDCESISQGYIRYKNPDKGVYKEEQKLIRAGQKADGSPDYKEDPNQIFGDWWVCDGEWVHQLNRTDKKAIRTQLPPELRGNNIPLSPLPFLFGVKSAEMKARYFVRPIAPPPAPTPGHNDAWIEAWPKRADDAGNYSRVQIALDKSDLLPNAMILFMPNWKPESPAREVFNFSQREVNSFLDKIKENVFMKAFIDTKAGNDWEVIHEPWIPPENLKQQPLLQTQTPNGQQPTGQAIQGQSGPSLGQSSQPGLSTGTRTASPGQIPRR